MDEFFPPSQESAPIEEVRTMWVTPPRHQCSGDPDLTFAFSTGHPTSPTCIRAWLRGCPSGKLIIYPAIGVRYYLPPLSLTGPAGPPAPSRCSLTPSRATMPALVAWLGRSPGQSALRGEDAESRAPYHGLIKGQRLRRPLPVCGLEPGHRKAAGTGVVVVCLSRIWPETYLQRVRSFSKLS